MERKIGEIFEYKGEWYQCVEGRCKDCHFSEKRFLCKQFITNDFCTHGIIFKKLDKVGEPFIIEGKLYQHYKVFDIDNVCGNDFWCVHNYKAKTLTIEITQNKEDMEEKKVYLKSEDVDFLRRKFKEITEDYIIQGCDKDKVQREFGKLFSVIEEKHSNSENIGKNLREFDLEAAKAGKPVCTRDGRKARIICFDYNGETGDYPIVALVHYNKGSKCYERVLKYTSDGLFNKYGDCQHDHDLMMLPEKKEGWVNVYNSLGVITFSHNPFDSKEEALAAEVESPNKYYVDTVKISWEE